MTKSWESIIWETILGLTVVGAVVFAAFILNLPHVYTPYRQDLIVEDSFSEKDKKNTESGYGYFAKHRGTNKTLKFDTSVTVLVLGDIGRSPRMQYHVASIARHGGTVSLVGYVESELIPEIKSNRFVRIIPLSPVPKRLQTSSKLLFPIVAPLKVMFQLWNIWKACGYRTIPTKWMLVQNPPSIPTLLIAQAVCFVRNTRLIIDWHNFGYTILALKLGENHPLVKIAELYERYVARWADAHFCVTNAMARVLKQKYGVDALPLHDRPAKQFQPLTPAQRSAVLHRLEGTKPHAKYIEKKEWRLVVSPTSWTPDEDFSLLLDAFVAYSATVSMDRRYPKILAIITGKGPLKDYYVNKINKLHDQKKLANIVIKTAWLSQEDYPALLGAADAGISLHKSSSGVDLPMKVVDMFGVGIPVFGYSKFEAWSELVQDGVNGMGFETADQLETLLEKAFTGSGKRLDVLRAGAEKETKRRWDDEWFPVAGRLLGMKGITVESDPVPEEKAETTTAAAPSYTVRGGGNVFIQKAPAPEEETSEEPLQDTTDEVSQPTVPTPEPVTIQNDAPHPKIPSPEPATVQDEAPQPKILSPEPATIQDDAPQPKIPSPEPATVQDHAPYPKVPSPEPATVQDDAPQPTIDNALGEGDHIDEGYVDVVNATPVSEEPSKPMGGTYLSYQHMMS